MGKHSNLVKQVIVTVTIPLFSCIPKQIASMIKEYNLYSAVSKVLSVLMSCAFVAPYLNKYLFYLMVSTEASW